MDIFRNHIFVQPGDSSIIKVTPGYLDAAIPVSVGIWIDFNQDGDFLMMEN